MGRTEVAVIITVIALICFALGLGFGVLVIPNIPMEFSCTESAVIEGYATCVKYERNK